MSDYSEFFLNCSAAIVELELIEVSHPDVEEVFRFCRNHVQGVTVTLEDASTAEFPYYPARISQTGVRDDLDQAVEITVGDLGEVLPAAFDAIRDADGFGTKPVVKYRTYRSDDLTAPLFGPWILEAKSFSHNKDGATFVAAAPSLNNNRTGELYRLPRFPMLRGAL
jgi:hypothetical protein